jgi:hypothetical protein
VVVASTGSTILKDAYAGEEEYRWPDPQTPPQGSDRSIAVEPDVLLASSAWGQLVAVVSQAPSLACRVWSGAKARAAGKQGDVKHEGENADDR